MADRVPGRRPNFASVDVAALQRKAWHAKWFGISLLLHALLALPVVLLRNLPPPPKSEQKLAIELFGMVSNRQTAAKQLGERVDRAAEKSRPKVAVQTKQEEKRIRQSTAESPVEVAKAEEQMSAPPLQQQNVPRGEDEQQKQQTLSSVDPQADALRKYLALLKKAIKARLVYPQEAQQTGQTGRPIISFRIGTDGQIEAGTLALRRSSGYALLDDNALRAARAATPLPAPPTEMTVALDIAFAEDKIR